MKKLNKKLKADFVKLYSQKDQFENSDFIAKRDFYFRLIEALYNLFKENIELEFQGNKELFAFEDHKFLQDIDTIALTLAYSIEEENDEESKELLKDMLETYKRNLNISYLDNVLKDN